MTTGMYLDLEDDDSVGPAERTDIKVGVHPKVRTKLHAIKTLNDGVTMTGLVNTALVHLLDLPHEYGDPDHAPVVEDALRSLFEEEVQEP